MRFFFQMEPSYIFLHSVWNPTDPTSPISCHDPSGGVGVRLSPPDDAAPWPVAVFSPPFKFVGDAAVVFTPLECRVRAAECQRMAAQAPNPRVQTILTDMARTWTRLAVEAEQAARLRRVSSQLSTPIVPLSWQVSSGK
jgi:hypothetical protein